MRKLKMWFRSSLDRVFRASRSLPKWRLPLAVRGARARMRGVVHQSARMPRPLLPQESATDIAGIMSRRVDALRALKENPMDLEAMKVYHDCHKQVGTLPPPPASAPTSHLAKHFPGASICRHPCSRNILLRWKGVLKGMGKPVMHTHSGGLAEVMLGRLQRMRKKVACQK